MLFSIANRVLYPLLLITSGCILILMGVSFSDVILRSLNRPIPGAYEITEIAVGAMVFSALPLVTLRQDHVRVTLFSALAKKHRWLQLLFTTVSRSIAVVVFIFFAWHLMRLGNQMNSNGARAIFAGFPLAPFAWFSAAMCLVSAVATLFSRKDPASEGVGEF
ncbi:TRAP transporter small permease [Gymnodinialimonas ceratoperidinii]|uniref:TRAP transporter small permease protein n=1 Tax=Gymnodinialimonas ceratoperidinii TaxID=2856823 RepID=A0A8F6TW50_9RHOB|nr:TRAP transporter small permease [Gymnodinialimonas ceratoperidinii]QXT40032.1 TRAP transporter small permease [Gymnodinialimonas ceratoperidinii]